jgi:hypothetical protein
MTSTSLVGSTGLVGSHILTTLVSLPSISSIHAYSRRDLPITASKLTPLTSSDTSSWPSQYPSSAPSIFFSALGTTARQAGSLAAQRKIDYDLNIALARAAQKAGTRVYVLISTAGASTSSLFPYAKMKGELDEAVSAMEFSHVVILKPGLLVGDRRDSRPGEYAARSVSRFLGGISGGVLSDFWSQDAGVVARAAVRAGLEALEGRQEGKVRVLSQGDVVSLGKAVLK